MANKRQQAFTLIEILVVIAISTALTVLIYANYHTGKQRYALSQATQQLVSDVRRAQTMAMSGSELTVGSKHYTGFGIVIKYNLEQDSYIFYGDLNGNEKYGGGDEFIERRYLPPGIRIVQPSTKFDIFFQSPWPTTYINTNDNPTGSVAVVLEVTGAGLPQKTVTIYQAGGPGRIEISP